MSHFEKSLKRTKGFEGGESNHPLDPGGHTIYGITERVARAEGYKGLMKDLPFSLAREIYKKKYWDILKLDSIGDEIISGELFDISVNMGWKVAGRFLQVSLNLLNRNERSWCELKEDGAIGAKTISVFNSVPKKDYRFVDKCVFGERYSRYKGIVKRDPRKEIFLRSWLNRTRLRERGGIRWQKIL